MTQNWVHPIPPPEAFCIDRILYDVQHDRAEEARFFADPRAYVAEHPGLDERAADALVNSDFSLLYRLGANPYLLRSYCLQLRIPEPEYLAALRAAGEEMQNG